MKLHAFTLNGGIFSQIFRNPWQWNYWSDGKKLGVQNETDKFVARRL